MSERVTPGRGSTSRTSAHGRLTLVSSAQNATSGVAATSNDTSARGSDRGSGANAASTSPLNAASRALLAAPVCSDNSTVGCSRRKAASTSGTMVCEAVSVQKIDSDPAGLGDWPSAFQVWTMDRKLSNTGAAPARTRTERPSRSKRGTPNDASTRCTARDTVD